MRLLVHPDARRVLENLRNDPEMEALLRKVLMAINLIRLRPGAREARREAWATERWGQVWAIPVQSGDDDWVVVWVPAGPDEAIVLYVGPGV